jgi:hypothetical protein
LTLGVLQRAVYVMAENVVDLDDKIADKFP